MMDQNSNKLAAQGESSCRQDFLVANDDDDDPTDTQGGSEHPIGSMMPIVTFVGGYSGAQGESGLGMVVGDKRKGKQVASKEIEGVKIDCLIDLDDVFIDDRESEDENVEIEFEKDDEGIKYATHEGFEFDALFINQINDQVLGDNQDKEEGEI
ncbi:hypothetical protein L1987_27496 [Smallanthus sonchifolius]|uniref:Uncharacterized protein n=1 Tax=Smallanthus sonchifolius TaxID=185202 RepID=A0ACB9IC82_9ASTR|nr:hypothetical protein L1987_27496 [Smallanthus sonchifolius]